MFQIYILVFLQIVIILIMTRELINSEIICHEIVRTTSVKTYFYPSKKCTYHQQIFNWLIQTVKFADQG